MSTSKSSESSSLSKADYLKKYLSTNSGEDKPKKKKSSIVKGRVRVVDDDAEVHLSVTAPVKNSIDTQFNDADDASDPDDINFKPTVAAVIDERPEDVQILETYSSGKWKSVGDGTDKKVSMNLEMRKIRSSTSCASISSKSVSEPVFIKEEPSAGVIILPDVRKSTTMRKAEEMASVARIKEEERQEKYSKWSKGLAQIAHQRERAEEAVKEMSKPLARYADDEDLEKMLKDRDRLEDPMLAFQRPKKRGSDGPSSSGDNKRPARGPPNRFGIVPGSRWDGVDRSNGFERELFLKMADRKTIREEEYIWSVEDW